MPDEALLRAAELISQGTGTPPDDDDDAMSLEDEALWQSARTLADLGELTARWIEGSIRSQPAYEPGSGPDEETAGLVPVLAAVNRAGFLTDCSQPAEPPTAGYDGRTCEQRAAVSGFADDDVLGRLRQATRADGLVIIARKPGPLQCSYRDAIPVTCADEEPCTWFGAISGVAEVTHQYEGTCHPDAVAAISVAWQVAIINLEWGRNDVLWPALERFAATSR